MRLGLVLEPELGEMYPSLASWVKSSIPKVAALAKLS